VSDNPADDTGYGFPPDAEWTPVPDVFFSRDLPALTGGPPVKVFLHLLWRTHRRTHRRPRLGLPAMRFVDLVADPTLRRSLEALGVAEIDVEHVAENAVDELLEAGLVLDAFATHEGARFRWLFPNSPEGRTALSRVESGALALPGDPSLLVPDYALADGEPDESIFRLYEDHVGPVTPMLAEELKEAEVMYPARWIRDAFRISVERNVRKWSYIRAILERWMREGRSDDSDRQSGSGRRRRYLEGRYSEYIEH
jgi:DNA replication protein